MKTNNVLNSTGLLNRGIKIISEFKSPSGSLIGAQYDYQGRFIYYFKLSQCFYSYSYKKREFVYFSNIFELVNFLDNEI